MFLFLKFWPYINHHTVRVARALAVSLKFQAILRQNRGHLVQYHQISTSLTLPMTAWHDEATKASPSQAFTRIIPRRPCRPSSFESPKRYSPESVDSLVTQWVESASGSESYRERHCQSDTLLGHSDTDVILRRLTKSVLNMECRRNADGFALPPTPTPTGSQLFQAGGESWYVPSVAPSDVSCTSLLAQPLRSKQSC